MCPFKLPNGKSINSIRSQKVPLFILLKLNTFNYTNLKIIIKVILKKYF